MCKSYGILDNKFFIRKDKKMKKKFKWLVFIAITLILIIGFRVLCVRTVEGGETGVKVRMGTVQEDVLTDGWHIRIPFITNIVKINNQVLRTDVDGESASKDLQTIKTTVSVNYRVKPKSAAYIYKNVGKDNEVWENTVLRPAIQEAVKAVVAKSTAEECITNRQLLSSEMLKEIKDKVNTYGIEVTDLNIINFDFSAEFNAAIEAKQTAQQNALKAQQDLERIKVEAQQKVEQARAEAEANKLKNAEITDKTLKMKWIEKWDGKLPIVSGSDNNILDVNSMLK